MPHAGELIKKKIICIVKEKLALAPSIVKKIANNFENNDFILLNGRTRSDSPAKYTYKVQGTTYKVGTSVIDLIWYSVGALPLVTGLKVNHIATSSDHFPVSLYLEGSIKNKKSNTVFKFRFDVEKVLIFYNNMSMREEVAWLDNDVDELNSIIITSIREVAVDVGMFVSHNINGNLKRKPWIDAECLEAKKRVLATVRR